MRVEKASGLGATKYKHLVVAVGVDDAPMRKLAEESFAEERAADADIIPSTFVLQPDRGYEPDEIERAFRSASSPKGTGRG